MMVISWVGTNKSPALKTRISAILASLNVVSKWHVLPNMSNYLIKNVDTLSVAKIKIIRFAAANLGV